MTDIQVPRQQVWVKEWNLPSDERRAIHSLNITFEDPILTTVDEEVADTLNALVLADYDPSRVFVWNGGDGVVAAFEGNVGDYVLDDIRERVHAMLGDQWAVRYKPSERFNSGYNQKHVLLQRLEGYHFRYKDEKGSDAEAYRGERPQSVSASAEVWADHYDLYERWTSAHATHDVLVYESSTGTQHLLPKNHSDGHLPQRPVTSGATCACGQAVSAEELAEHDAITHYADHLIDAADGYGWPLDDRSRLQSHLGADLQETRPPMVLDNVCKRCWATSCYEVERNDGPDKKTWPMSGDRTARDFATLMDTRSDD